MYENLRIILYPDPRLKRIAVPIEEFGPDLAALAARMVELMREHKGVGLAAPQVGKGLRIFISNHTGKPEDDLVYVNPFLLDAEEEETGNEGCLSIPEVHVDVVRSKSVTIRAQDVTGKPFERRETGYLPRIWQHELDHLNGIMLTDRMSPSAKMEHRKKLKELEEKYEAEHPKPTTKHRRPLG